MLIEIIIIIIIFIMKVMNNSHELFQIADKYMHKYMNLLIRNIECKLLRSHYIFMFTD